MSNETQYSYVYIIRDRPIRMYYTYSNTLHTTTTTPHHTTCICK